MSNIINPLIEEYIRALTPSSESLLRSMEDYATANHVPIVQPEVAKLLEVITRISGGKNVLEVGTAIGYSALVFCGAMDQGRVVTIERRKDMLLMAEAFIKESGHDQQIEMIHGSAEEILPTLKEEFDIIFLDAAKGRYLDFLNSCSKLLKHGGILISDNVLYKGMVASDEYVVRRKKTIVTRMRTYLDYIMENPDFSSCVIPIGDGVAISYKV